MGFEDEVEKGLSSSFGQIPKKMTLEKAVEMGEYDPSYLSTFEEWRLLTRHLQFQYIKKVVENRRSQFSMQWSSINNVLNFSLKPELKEALRNIEKNLKKLDKDEERLYIEYSK
jgi:hypothetical protein